MSKRVKPKRDKAHRPKRVASNNMFLAAQNMAVLTDAERAFLVTPLREAFEAMRSGHCSIEQWELLADAANIAGELVKLLICTDQPSVSILTEMLLALGSVCTRYHRTGRIGATGEELKAIAAGIERHDIQLMFTTGLDLKKAGAALEQLKAQARAGRVPSLSIKHAEATT